MCLLCGDLGDHTTHCIPPLSAHGINLFKCWPEHSCLHTLSRLPDCNSDQSIYRNQDYCIYLNRRHPRIVTTQLEALNEIPPSNISYMAIICGSAHVGIFPDDDHHGSTRVIYVVQVVSTTHSRTERLRILLTVSSNCHHLVHVPTLSSHCWCLWAFQKK